MSKVFYQTEAPETEIARQTTPISKPTQRKLRLGILVNSYKLPSWQYAILRKLIESDFATIEVVICKDEPAKQPVPLLRKSRAKLRGIVRECYETLDRRLFATSPNAFAEEDASELLQHVPRIDMRPISDDSMHRFTHDQLSLIESFGLDVMIKFGFGTLKGGILNSAKYGVWSFHHGDNHAHRGAPAGFWEVLENWNVQGSILEILTEDPDAGKVLARSYSSVDRRSVHRNKNNCYWKSLSFLPRKLKQLHEQGETEFFKHVDKLNQYPPFYSNRLLQTSQLNNWTMAKLLARHAMRYACDKLHNLAYSEQWILLYRIEKDISTTFYKFSKLSHPTGGLYADPFVVYEGGKYYIFIEEMAPTAKHACLSVITMDDAGNYSRPVKILSGNSHLSYPFVFKNAGTYYLIPESRAARAISLYRCSEFPHQWEFDMHLIKGIDAADATMFYHQGKWWMFANIVENKGASSYDELHLFFADELRTQKWTPHPLNPVVSDVRRSRPAGRVFTHRGKIIRPSQNSAQRYGYSININEIKVINETQYEEVPIASIEPNWSRDIVATHTFNYACGLTVIDAVMEQPRIWNILRKRVLR